MGQEMDALLGRQLLGDVASHLHHPLDLAIGPPVRAGADLHIALAAVQPVPVDATGAARRMPGPAPGGRSGAEAAGRLGPAQDLVAAPIRALGARPGTPGIEAAGGGVGHPDLMVPRDDQDRVRDGVDDGMQESALIFQRGLGALERRDVAPDSNGPGALAVRAQAGPGRPRHTNATPTGSWCVARCGSRGAARRGGRGLHPHSRGHRGGSRPCRAGRGGRTPASPWPRRRRD